MSVADDLNEVFEKMPEAFASEKANNLKATVQLELTGEAGGNFVVKINNGTIAVNPGQVSEPNLKLTMAASDYVAISKGEANPAMLLKGGRLKAQGDIILAMKFQSLFDRNRVNS